MIIDNDIQLQQVILNDLNEIIDEVAGKLLKSLKKSIQKEVYDAGTPIVYERQWDENPEKSFMESFETSTAVTMMGEFVEAWIEHDPMSMNLDELYNIHTTGGKDLRSILADIIIAGRPPMPDQYYATNKYGFWTEPRDFWEPFMKELNKNGNKFIESAFRMRGIVYKKIS